MAYKVNLEKFEGPLDLLLFLIRKNEVEIYDIPIAKITQQFLEYLDIIKQQDLESAADFILMAATLMRIKAQMLLPRTLIEEDEEYEDPRTELINQLLEYKRFKEVASDFGEMEDRQRLIYPRAFFRFENNGFDEEEIKSDVSLYELIAAFQNVIKRAKTQVVHTVHELDVTIEDRIAFVLETLNNRPSVDFVDLFSEIDSKIVMIVTFLAILQLINDGKIRLSQPRPFTKIRVNRA